MINCIKCNTDMTDKEERYVTADDKVYCTKCWQKIKHKMMAFGIQHLRMTNNGVKITYPNGRS